MTQALRLFCPEDAGAGQTLTQFFREWYSPVLLVSRDVSPQTRLLYDHALVWWAQLTGDPPLTQITSVVTAQFVEALKSATYKRGPLGKPRALSRATVHKHAASIHSILQCCGARRGRREGAKLVSDPPMVPLPKKNQRVKLAYTLEELPRIFAAASQPEFARAPWQRLLGLLFYTGLRVGTVFRLTWERVRTESKTGDRWIEVPSWLEAKTAKASIHWLHPCLAYLLQAYSDHVPTTPLVDWPYSHAHTLRVHARILDAAGVAKNDLHGWRRTYAHGVAGAWRNLRDASLALGHSSSQTTGDHYVRFSDLAMQRVREFPWVVPEPTA